MTMKHLSHSKKRQFRVDFAQGFDLLALVLVSVLPFGLGLGSQPSVPTISLDYEFQSQAEGQD